MKFDAVIIGGGPSGATLATLLAQQGRHVAVVEKVRFPRRKVCGDFLSAVNMPLLDRLSVGSEFRRLAGPEVERVALFAGGPGIERPMPRARRHAFGRALERQTLDALVLAAAREAGAVIFQPYRAEGLLSHGVICVAEAERIELDAPVIVAAHGSWERGMLPTNARREHAPFDYLGFKAYFRGASLRHDLMSLMAFPGGYGGMVWAGQGHVSLSFCIRRDTLSTLRHDGLPAGEAACQHIASHCPAAADVLAGARVDGGWLAAGPIWPGIRARYESGIFRVGNAAGESHPIIAEGISMAMQSSWLLASALGQVPRWDEKGREEAARIYAAAWRRQFALRVKEASLLAALASRPLTAEVMRRFVEVAPAALSWGARLSGKTLALPEMA